MATPHISDAITSPRDAVPQFGPGLVLVSHVLCPYVQRAVIALREKEVPFRRLDIDLANTPEWFLRLSPFGKTPVLVVGGEPVFESAVILEYLEETQARPLHPASPLDRAEHRGWIEFASAILADIAGLYSAATREAFDAKVQSLRQKFDRVEARLHAGPFFAGDAFSLVDAAFAPVFRYFEVLDDLLPEPVIQGARSQAWRAELMQRRSVREAVSVDYPERLTRFLATRPSYLATKMQALAPA